VRACGARVPLRPLAMWPAHGRLPPSPWPRYVLRALIDCVKQFPGPWAPVSLRSRPGVHPAGSNRQADATTREHLPLPNRLLATGPLVAPRRDGHSLYLWH